MPQTEFFSQLKKNDETFQNSMERIFQKYSNLDDLGPDVCLKTMTFISERGSVPLNSAAAKKEVRHLVNHLKNQPIHAVTGASEEQTIWDQDTVLSSCKTDISMEDLHLSNKMENSTSSLWCGNDTSQMSLKSMISSRSCLWDQTSQPEEEDQDLERTLNSNGSSLLEFYPSMLNKIGEAYRRLHVTNVAGAVLRRYRRRRWHSSQAKHCGHNSSNSYNRTLNRTRESARSVTKPANNKIPSYQKSTSMYQGSSPHKGKMDFSPLKGSSNTSHVSTACFYSPRRDDLEKRTGKKDKDGSFCWTVQPLNSESRHHQPVRVLDFSTPPSSGSSSPRSPSPDHNQTYIVKPVPLPKSCELPDSSVTGTTLSPLKMARMASLASQKWNTVNPPPSYRPPSLHRDSVFSNTTSPQKAFSNQLSQLRSPLKLKSIGNHQTFLPHLKQALPVIHTSEVCQSPYKGQRYSSFSSHQKNPTNQLKRQRSFSSHCSSSSLVSRRPSQKVDVEFTSLYHQFICRRTNSTSSCHLCKSRSGILSPTLSSTSMSALSLTPVRSQKRRRREPEVVESLRFKRFRESCSPQRTPQFWPKQRQETCNEYVNSTMVELDEDQYTRNRAFFLQCPSPGFLGARRQSVSGNSRTRPGSRPDLQTRHNFPSWRGPGAGQVVSEGIRSPTRTWHQSGISLSPRLSRRRLLSDF